MRQLSWYIKQLFPFISHADIQLDNEMIGCICQECGTQFKVDLMVPDYIWQQIVPIGKEGRLFCGACIMRKIETISDYAAWRLVKII